MNLRRLLAALPLAAALALALAPAAGAAAVTAAGFTDRGAVLVAVGTVDGLDPTKHAQVNVTMAGSATVTCITPTDALVKTGISVSQGSAADLLQPGETVFGVATRVPVVSAQNAGCPADTLIVVVNDVEFLRAVITVIQDGTVQTFGYAPSAGLWRPV